MSAYADVPVPKVDPAERVPSPETGGPPSCADLAAALIGTSGKLEAELGMLYTALTFSMGHSSWGMMLFVYVFLLVFTPSCWPVMLITFSSAVAAEKAGREKADRERDDASFELDRVQSKLDHAGVELDRVKIDLHQTGVELDSVKSQLDQKSRELDRVRTERDEEADSEFQIGPDGSAHGT